MRRRPLLALGILLASLAGLIGLSPVATAEDGDRRGPTVYVGELTSEQFATLAGSGVDRHEITARRAGGARVGVEVVLSRTEAAKLSGLGLTEKRIDGQVVSKRLQTQSESDHGVFRPYSGPGGLAEELEAIANSHPRLVKKVVLGQSVRGQDIVALKLTRNARTVRDGARPAVLYLSAQHAREWITPEMTRRLLWHYLDTYGTDRETTRILDTTELWFVPVANPDGYDYTFTPGQRLWRKNLRDNNGDGQLTDTDGVDPNRNFPTKWNYDDEGSSSAPASQTYRGTGPASEPETRAMDRLMRKIRFAFAVNYHSAAELVLYGVGWQVATPSPDDEIAEALAGDDAHPAVPGYDPDLGAELYTTNGDTDEHASSYGTIAFTPEMSTCATVSAIDPDDAFAPEDCESVFNFPDYEPLIQAEYAKNLAFAVSVAKSARNPDDPVSVVGRQAPDFVIDPFDVSYGASQSVAVVAKKALRGLRLNYSVNGGRVRQAPVRAWKGGERYGDSGRRYYSEFRGRVRGTKAGDSVEVWFTAAGGRAIQAASAGNAVANTAPDTRRARRSSEHFTYTVARTRRADVVVIADEDYNGVNPRYTPALSAPKYAQSYVDDLAAKGITAAVWDVSKQGVPHHLGVLSHFKAAVWYLGDNRLTQDPEDEQTDVLGNPLTDAAVAERAQYLTLSVRDYLNEGGKLLYTGETAGYSGSLGAALGGIYYGLDGAPDQDCVVSEDPFSDCLLLANDFVQYYLGGYARTPLEGPTSVLGTSRALAGRSYSLGGAAASDNPLDEPGSFAVTSTLLPPQTYPQFASTAAGFYAGADGGAYDPYEGGWYVAVPHADDLWTRLTRTVDLASVNAGQAPSLDFALSFDMEPGYDNVIVEAHTVGQDDWTTLAEASGRTDSAVPDDCGQGFLIGEHPFLARYLTLGDAGCTATGTTGSWNRLTGNSGGWQQVSYDLSAYAGKQVEVSVSYVSDPAFGGLGVFVDDTRIAVGGTRTEAEGFESGLGPWAVTGPPPGSAPNAIAFSRSQAVFAAAITTRDTVLLGFGVEQVSDRSQRAELLGRVMRYLLR